MLWNNEVIEKVISEYIEHLYPNENQPFQVRDDEEMQTLVDSIKRQGVKEPLIVRSIHTGGQYGYEIISGHRRYAACKKLGLKTIPIIIRTMTDDEATLCTVDSNLHREHILPSEKAFAYQAKMEVLNRQGQRNIDTSSQPATKYDAATEVGKALNESRDQVYRYIRLTELVKPLLELVDKERISFTPAVELSYLPKEFQNKIVEIYEMDDRTPSYAQAVKLKKEYEKGKLTMEKVEEIMAKPKANQRETVKFSYEKLAKFFPDTYTPKQMEEAIVKILEEAFTKKQEPKEHKITIEDEIERFGTEESKRKQMNMNYRVERSDDYER